LDVEFYIFAVAGIFPGILAMFHLFFLNTPFDVFAFKAIEGTYV